jgi:hypothetical protein
MFDTMPADLEAWLDEPQLDAPEPDWSEHPVYSAMVPAVERLAELLELPPAARPTGELARMDARSLPAGARLDLLAALQEQKNWIEAVQAQVLAEIDAADSTALKLSHEAVSLVLKVPLPAAQAKLRAGRTLVRELPKTLRLLATTGQAIGPPEISEPAAVLAGWSLPVRPVQFDPCLLRTVGRAGPGTAGRPRRPRPSSGSSHAGGPSGRR